MGNLKLNRAKKVKNDEFYTQLKDVKAELDHYTDHFKGKTIYCNCDTPNSAFIEYFKTQPIKKLLYSGINPATGLGTDFRDQTAIIRLKQADIVITNPPFSLKQKFLERAYRLGKPFAFLLPLTTFETKKRQVLFKKYGLEVIFFDKRINFKTPSGKGSGSWFATAWFTNGLNIGSQINFESLLLTGQKSISDFESNKEE